MIAPLLLAAVGLALFFAPHRGHNATAAKRTLFGMTRDLFQYSTHGNRHARKMLAIGTLGCGAVFLPALLMTAIRLAPDGATRWLLGVGALLLSAAALTSWLLLVLSRTTFGFGPGQARDATIVATLIPLFVAGSAGAAAWGALSPAFATWLRTV